MKTPSFLTSVASVGLLVAAATFATQVLSGAERDRRAADQAFMRQKLAWSQAILEGLTLEKFDRVSQGALRLRNMTQSNLWTSVRQPDYLAATTNFQKDCDILYKAAIERNLEQAADAYGRVTRDCIECHRMVRTEQNKNAGGVRKSP